jgi:hypothetical protein
MEKEAQHTGKTSPAFTQSQKRSFNVIPAIQKDIDLNGKLLHELFDFIQVNRRNIQRDNGLLKWCIDMQLKVQQSEAANIIGRIVFRDCEEKLAMYDERDKLLIRTLNEFGCSIRFEDLFEEGWDFSACFSQHDDIDMTPEPAVVEALCATTGPRGTASLRTTSLVLSAFFGELRTETPCRSALALISRLTLCLRSSDLSF